MIKFNSETEFIGQFRGRPLLKVIKENLKTCDSFQFSVSFIRYSGLELLLDDMKAALGRGAKGSVITTDYQRITEEESLKELLKLKKDYKNNFRAYFLQVDLLEGYKSFHTKGYIFNKGNETSVIVGSANISATALSREGGEWSLHSRTLSDYELIKNILEEFALNQEKIGTELNEKQIDDYAKVPSALDFSKVEPNYMQISALNALSDLRMKGKKKALIVAAMGSGKTYLSAFDSKVFGASRILYLCSEENILKNAKEQFQNVFENTKTYGFYTGNAKEKKADIVFSTNLTMVRHLEDFQEHEFDYIIVDEAHHSLAATYKKILSYFKPEFTLGMTGTPDRTDSTNAKEMFGDNIPFELSLRDAISNDLIMPFKYYSVYDKDIDYKNGQSDENIAKMMLVPSHVRFIKSHIDAHLDEIDGKLKCLAFCVTVEHAMKMAEAFNALGIPSDYVCAKTSVEDRARLYSRLQDENDDLKIIFSVNVMNEGVDLPRVNMSLFLRPTESSIVFIQQLGRSLRKAPNKKKPVIIDFIGCKYARSTYIAWALGEFSNAPILSKPRLASILEGKSNELGKIGIEVNIDNDSLKEIKEFLRKANFNKVEMLQKNYNDFKNAYSPYQVPSLMQIYSSASGFNLNGLIKTQKSYYKFLKYIKEANIPEFNKYQAAFIDYLSDFLPLSRSYEFTIFKTLLTNGKISKQRLAEEVEMTIKNEYGDFNKKSYDHALGLLLEPSEGDEKTRYYVREDSKGDIYLDVGLNDIEIRVADEFDVLDMHNAEFRAHVFDILDYGLTQYSSCHKHSGAYFEMHQAYTRREIKRVVCANSLFPSMTGIDYFRNTDKEKCAILIDLIKDKASDDNLNYGDKFIDKKTFVWESQTGTELENNKGKKLLSWGTYEVFVRKYKQEDMVNMPYYYLGECVFENPRNSKNKGKTIEVDATLLNELTDELFEQFNVDLKANKIV
ncbi:MAG: DUF3427 domain-containing protein [Bacilli bacterium]|nr:DUF3427 domain-containing protein [Bacilli bacterium]